MTQHLQLDQIIDASDATVIVHRNASGRVADAHFDLSGLPRVDAMMVGRQAGEVPALAERLCGICPVAHHLAGVQAIEAMSGSVELTPTVLAVRRLLNYGSVIDSHVLGFASQDLAVARVLRRFAQLAMAAAGSPKHFPTTAVPGGIAQAVRQEDLDALLAALPEAQASAEALVDAHLDDDPTNGWFMGADVALTGVNGQLDLMGQHLRAAAADGSVIVAGADAAQWDEVVSEAVPGSSAPRLYLTALGPDNGLYRTGPVAQLRVGRVSTPFAAAAQRVWLSGGARAAAARAIVVLHCVEAIAQLTEAPELALDDIGEPLSVKPEGIGVGWIETGRGLLVHRYQAGADGKLSAATILTPTAQNEPWLAVLLKQAGDAPDVASAMEDAIREADPCLPCSTAPKGQMGLVISDDDAPKARPRPAAPAVGPTPVIQVAALDEPPVDAEIVEPVDAAPAAQPEPAAEAAVDAVHWEVVTAPVEDVTASAEDVTAPAEDVTAPADAGPVEAEGNWWDLVPSGDGSAFAVGSDGTVEASPEVHWHQDDEVHWQADDEVHWHQDDEVHWQTDEDAAESAGELADVVDEPTEQADSASDEPEWSDAAQAPETDELASDVASDAAEVPEDAEDAEDAGLSSDAAEEPASEPAAPAPAPVTGPSFGLPVWDGPTQRDADFGLGARRDLGQGLGLDSAGQADGSAGCFLDDWSSFGQAQPTAPDVTGAFDHIFRPAAEPPVQPDVAEGDLSAPEPEIVDTADLTAEVAPEEPAEPAPKARGRKAPAGDAASGTVTSRIRIGRSGAAGLASTLRSRSKKNGDAESSPEASED